MSILRWFEKPVSWPVETKKAINSAVLGILIFVERGIEERLIVKTIVRFLVHLVCFLYEQWDSGCAAGILAHDTGLLKKDLTLVLEKSSTLNVMPLSGMESAS